MFPFSINTANKSALELGLEKGYEYYDALITTKTGLAKDDNNRNLVHYLVEKEDKDELEKSIITSFADDVIVGVKGKQASIVVLSYAISVK